MAGLGAAQLPRLAVETYRGGQQPRAGGQPRAGRQCGRGLHRGCPWHAQRPTDPLAPRRLLSITLQIVAVLLVGAPLVAITQPFLPPFGGLAVLAGVLVLLGIGFYRSASELDGHLRAGAELVVSALAKQSAAEQSGVDLARRMLPGLGDFTAVRVGEGSEADTKTLAGLNLRGRTGATVLALLRGDHRIPYPEAGERLESGDLVALTGTHEAIDAAKRLLSK